MPAVSGAEGVGEGVELAGAPTHDSRSSSTAAAIAMIAMRRNLMLIRYRNDRLKLDYVNSQKFEASGM